MPVVMVNNLKNTKVCTTITGEPLEEVPNLKCLGETPSKDGIYQGKKRNRKRVRFVTASMARLGDLSKQWY